jgi:hypothetical protein
MNVLRAPLSVLAHKTYSAQGTEAVELAVLSFPRNNRRPSRKSKEGEREVHSWHLGNADLC